MLVPYAPLFVVNNRFISPAVIHRTLYKLVLFGYLRGI
jgi:hypothetical protein